MKHSHFARVTRLGHPEEFEFSCAFVQSTTSLPIHPKKPIIYIFTLPFLPAKHAIQAVLMP